MTKNYVAPELEILYVNERDIILGFSLEFDFDVFEEVFGGENGEA